MLLIVFVGLGLLGFAVSYAVAWLLLLIAPAWAAGAAATFSSVAAVVVAAGADGVRRFRMPRAILIAAGGGALLGVVLSGAVVEDGPTLGWWLLGAFLGLVAGLVIMAARET